MRAKPILALIRRVSSCLPGCDFEDLGGFWTVSRGFPLQLPAEIRRPLSVEAFNGSVEISTWEQETVDISGTKYARSQDETADLKIEIDHSADSVSIRAIRPTCGNGNYGAKFVIKVPRGVVLDHLTTSNGAIRASDGVGPARLKTSNGGIQVRHPRRAECRDQQRPGGVEQFDGAVRAIPRTAHIRGEGSAERWRRPRRTAAFTPCWKSGWRRAPGELQRRNRSDAAVQRSRACAPTPAITGSLCTCRAKSTRRLSAATSNGSISSDFEMRMRGEISKHHLEGRSETAAR